MSIYNKILTKNDFIYWIEKKISDDKYVYKQKWIFKFYYAVRLELISQ